MALPPAPHAAKVAIRDRSTGQVIHVWSVDAREYINTRPEQYEYATEAKGPAVAPPAPVAPPEVSAPVDYAAALEALGYAQLQDMARRAGLQNINLKKPAMIAALVPHLEGGTLSLVTPAAVLGLAPAPQL